MQLFYPAAFDREMGCTEAEWLGWLPAAIGAHPFQLTRAAVQVTLPDGALAIDWQAGPPRVIALLRMPRLLVTFRFQLLDDAARYVFMKRFDLYMQRGGG
jgi:hypothetical protein